MSLNDEGLLPLSAHLAELRNTIIKAMIVFAATFVLLLFLYSPLLQLLTSPYTQALFNTRAEEPLKSLPVHTQLLINQNQAEMRYSCSDCNELPLSWGNGTVRHGSSFLIPPGGTLLISKEAAKKSLVLLSPAEGFLSIMKVAFWGSLLLSAPLWGFFLYQFISPALRQNQHRFLYPFLIVSFLCMAAGIAFAYLAIIPAANHYLMFFNASLGENFWSLGSYLDYTLLLMLANGVAFELGAVLFFAIHSGQVQAAQLVHYRRHAIVAAFVIAALLTPPDILTQFLLAVPLCLLYEGGIIYAHCKKMKTTF